jgi:hypothetical protein
VDEWDSNSDNGGVARLARDQPGGTMSTPFQISLAPNQLLQAINPWTFSQEGGQFEFNPTAKQGVYGGYKGWLQRAGRDRSLGEGHVNFKAIFAKLAGYDFGGWAVYEWEDCLQHPEVAARKGAEFIANHIIQVTDRVFDDFAATGADHATNLKLLGIKG